SLSLYSIYLRSRYPQLHPPFPYTTLFRSRRNRVDNRRVERQARRARAPLREGRVNLGLRGPQRRVARDLTEHETAIDQPRERRRDRKSTRLNSSHVKSSYAVFCLKNKKIK